MIIKPYKNDLWFKLPHLSRVPDLEDRYFARKGEFSPESDAAFNKHINRLEKLNHNSYYKSLNGSRIKEIRRQEALWY